MAVTCAALSTAKGVVKMGEGGGSCHCLTAAFTEILPNPLARYTVLFSRMGSCVYRKLPREGLGYPQCRADNITWNGSLICGTLYVVPYMWCLNIFLKYLMRKLKNTKTDILLIASLNSCCPESQAISSCATLSVHILQTERR